MKLITFDNLDSEFCILEYKLNNENTTQYLSNVAEHISSIYKFRKPLKGAERDKFIIKYSGNKKSILDDRDIAFYVLLKEKESTKYLIESDVFEATFKML